MKKNMSFTDQAEAQSAGTGRWQKKAVERTVCGLQLRTLFPRFVFVLLFLSLFSCAKKEVLRPAEAEPFNGPVTIGTLRESVGFGKVGSIKALAGIVITKHGDPAGSLSGVFAYKAPGRLRMDLFGPFGLTVAEVLMSGDLLQVYVPPKNVLYESDSPEVSLAGLMADGFSYEMSEDDDGYVLRARKKGTGLSDITALYYFDRTYLLNRSMSFSKDGTELLNATFDNFNGRVPERAKVVFANGMALDVSLEETEIGSDISDEYFSPVGHGDKQVKSLQEVFRRFAPDR